MATEILISSDPLENRVAIVEDGTLAELYIEREERVIGSIFKGKVHNVLPGMGAAFTDIGMGRNAFLYVDDINKQPLNIGDVEITQGYSGFTIGEKVRKGDDVLVQIVKEPRGLKGARVSTNISLPGRYLILMPTGRYSGVSRKIESADERNRLKALLKRIRPEGMATVVRTAAAGVSEAEIIADLGVLIRMWHGILETFKRAPSPSLLHKDMNLVFKAARDFVTADVERVFIDDEAEYRKVREFLQLLGPQYLDRIEHYNNGRSLFADYHIDEEIDRLMKPKINLPSGGSIVIESTEALTVIDVNSGKFTGGKNLEDTISKTNIEAAHEVARQVRLRDIGGIIVVDFIDMNSEAMRNRVLKTLEDGLRRDRTRATIQSFSALGLLEFTRKRIGKDLAQQLRGGCPTCVGLGTVLSPQSVAIEALRRLRMMRPKAGEHLLVHGAPSVAAQLDFWYEDECADLAKQLGTRILVRVDPSLHPEDTRVLVKSSNEKFAELGLRVGDEAEVTLLPGRMPNPTSAAAVMAGRIVEVENAANLAGNTAKVRVLDIDDEADYVLGELLAAVPGEAKKKRRRKRGTPLTSAEQAAELRELAAEAAKQAQGRPPIGITTVTEEEEAQDKALAAEVKGEHLADAILIGEVAHDAPHEDATADGGRGRGRRRRRGRRGRGGSPDSVVGKPPQRGVAPAHAPAAPEEHDDGDEIQPAATPGNGVPGSGEPHEGGRHRRRRRRGRRGRGGAGQPPAGSVGQPMPDRHIFRVGSDGAAEPTGVTAPREPSRALAPIRGAKPPAVEAPPPSLSAPEETAKFAKPTGRRRSSSRVAGKLEGTPIPALPAPTNESAKRSAPSAATSKRVARKKPIEASVSEKPKRTVAKPVATAAKAAPKAAKAAPKATVAKAAPKATVAKAAPKASAAKAAPKATAAKAAPKATAAKAAPKVTAAKAAPNATAAKPAANRSTTATTRRKKS